MKRVFIVNPTAGNGQALKVGKMIEQICEDQLVNYHLYYTNHPKDATELTKLYCHHQEPTVIYSVGGDGTLSEIVNGIVGSKAMLGIIPAGSGNDFIRTLSDCDKEITKIDVGKVNEHYFINIASIGIDAEIANNVTKFKKLKIPKSWIYNASIIYTLGQYQHKQINYHLNDKQNNKSITLMAICNGRYYGGGFCLAPNALINDGLFDIYLVDAMPKYKIPGALLKLKKQLHEQLPVIHKYNSNHIKVEAEERLICNVDGEIIYDNHFDFKLLDKEITLYQRDDLKIKQLIKK
ncbi:MAG: diacylglycerol kinase family lipid kinase [Bacilli bacterium]|nr:diacylglycerol kinase family lipid kinase [Bacilli bacterium]MDD4809271.1 diacylglycerol kinase family lipid kinase [Bacilli bacterium]